MLNAPITLTVGLMEDKLALSIHQFLKCVVWLGLIHFALSGFYWSLLLWPDVYTIGFWRTIKHYFDECGPTVVLLMAYTVAAHEVKKKWKPCIKWWIGVILAATCLLFFIDLYFDRYQLLYLGHDGIPARKLYANWWWLYFLQ